MAEKAYFCTHHLRSTHMAEHNDLGKWGEQKAVDFLHAQGYVIRHCDWRCGQRDIDIVALSPDGITCVFVEVKTRRSAEVVLPEDAVDVKKMRSLGVAADAYVKLHDVRHELRFDIISVVGTSDTDVRIEHFADAFNPLLI